MKTPSLLGRLFLSCLIGMVIAGLCLNAGWDQTARLLDFHRVVTQRKMRVLQTRVEEYQRVNHTLPSNLGVIPLEGLSYQSYGGIRDDWNRPFVYTRKGNHFRLLSYGKDGKPGGIGEDTDVDSDLPNRKRVKPTFRQFLEAGTDTTVMIAVITGLLGGLYSFKYLAAEAPFSKKNAAALIFRLLIVLCATTFVGLVMALLAYPPGH